MSRFLLSKLKVIIIAYFLFSNLCYSQAELPKIAPLSPEAASIAKFAEVPVSYYTGVPNISIPITSLKGRSISVPVSIGYHAGGHKVNDIASWVGLGWNLNVGGQVYRVMKQLPDDFSEGKGYLTTNMTISEFEDLLPNDKKDALQAATNVNATDFAPDEFHFNFMGHTGKFMFNQNRSVNHPYGEIVLFPKSDVKIVPIFNNNKKIIEWEITTTDGNKYFFGELRNGHRAVDEITKTISYSADQGSLPQPALAPYNFSYFTSWKLTRIETFKNETITFNYRQEPYSSCVPTGESDIMNWAGGVIRSSSKTEGVNSIIEEVVSDLGRVEFNHEPSLREDLSYSFALDNIALYDLDNKQIENIKFIKDYFQSTVPTEPFFICDGTELNNPSVENYSFADEISKRLRLNEVRFYNKDNTSFYKYQMEYNTNDKLPHRLSKSQDYWGYFNGKDNTTLIPSMFYIDPIPSSSLFLQNFFFKGADRTINPNLTQANMLKKIIYPEGGYTLFEYENNRASGNFNYKNSQNIFEPYFEGGVSMNTENDATSQSIQTISKTFTVPVNIDTQLPISIISNSDIYDNTEPVNGEETHNLPQQGQDIHFFIKQGNNIVLGDPVWGVPIGYDVSANLAPGTYTLELVINTSGIWSINPQNHDIAIDVSWRTRQFDERLIGGLRIKSIKNYDGQNTLQPSTIRNYHYKTIGTNEESGWIVDVPVFQEIIVVAPEGANTLKTKLSSNNLIPLITTQGNYVGYTSVTEEKVDQINGKSQYSSYNFSFIPPASSYNGAPSTFEWESGNLTKSVHYQMKPLGGPIVPNPLPLLYNSIPVKEDTKQYNYNFGIYDRQLVEGVDLYQKRYLVSDFEIINTKYQIKNGIVQERKSSSKSLFYDDVYQLQDSIYSETTMFFSNPFIHLSPIAKETNTSDGDVLREEYIYPIDLSIPNPLEQSLIDQNRITTPLKVKSIKNNINSSISSNLSQLDTEYFNFGNDLILPESISTSKGGDPLEERIKYHSYDTYGNPLEVSKAGGTHISYIWGYNQSQPIAKIENATYSQISTQVSNLQTKSDNDDDRTIGYLGNEGLLREALDNLRVSLPDALVTTFTYDPLIGVTSITDPRGNTIYYHYDGFNRLEYVKDEDGNILSKNEYNYKN